MYPNRDPNFDNHPHVLTGQVRVLLILQDDRPTSVHFESRWTRWLGSSYLVFSASSKEVRNRTDLVNPTLEGQGPPVFYMSEQSTTQGRSSGGACFAEKTSTLTL